MDTKFVWLFLIFLLWNRIDIFSQKFFEVETMEQAEIKIWYVMNDAECDLKVHFVYDESSITKVGLWMEVPEPEQADIKIIFVDDPSLADINVCVTDYADQAGWLKQEKSKIIKY